jgi:hypothetical protein
MIFCWIGSRPIRRSADVARYAAAVVDAEVDRKTGFSPPSCDVGRYRTRRGNRRELVCQNLSVERLAAGLPEAALV